MNTALQITNNNPLLSYAGDNRNTVSRISLFVKWQMETGGQWFNPDLAAYRDHLLSIGRQHSSVRAHLSSVRSAYAAIGRSNTIRDMLYSVTTAETPADKQAQVSELLIRIANATDPHNAPVAVVTIQDRADSAEIRLTVEQAKSLLSKPAARTPKGLRDLAILSLALCAGLREAELADLDIDDLKQSYGGELALLVRAGKGEKQRLIPYGEMSWCLPIIDRMLDGRTAGPVFRPLKPGNGTHGERLTTRTIQNIVGKYQIVIDGKKTTARPHDLRRSYARLQYDAGMSVEALQQNLGHTSQKTTLGYIGALNADQRRAKAAFSFELPEN